MDLHPIIWIAMIMIAMSVFAKLIKAILSKTVRFKKVDTMQTVDLVGILAVTTWFIGIFIYVI